MAANSDANTDSDPDADVGWADQDAYQEQTKETEDVELPDGQMKMRIVQETPMRQAALTEKYDVKDLKDKLDELPDEADIQQNPESISDDDQEGILKMIAYIRDLLEPNVIKPDVHWADPDADGFDLSTLSDRDLEFMIGKVSGRDIGVAKNATRQQRAESFRGE